MGKLGALGELGAVPGLSVSLPALPFPCAAGKESREELLLEGFYWEMCLETAPEPVESWEAAEIPAGNGGARPGSH